MNENSTKQLQSKLRYLSQDYDNLPAVAVDGIYGDETKRAVAELQRMLGFTADGETDDKTLTAIDELYRTSKARHNQAVGVQLFPEDGQPMVFGSRGVSRAALNLMLGQLALVFSNLPKIESVDLFGEDTLQSVALIQQSSGLEITGQVDKTTFNVIARLFNEFRGGIR